MGQQDLGRIGREQTEHRGANGRRRDRHAHPQESIAQERVERDEHEPEQVDIRQAAELVADERQQIGQEEPERAPCGSTVNAVWKRVTRYAGGLPIASEMKK